ncbi:Crp/Fnr family transcriptional regulator [Pedobacter sp. KBW06]|uniref:Crp/Fnr family transcriptional regulator n=1 Tax=Pedobacter sp. KBW06 TaxID=2153359 RepID=UPI000F5A4332|nr:Crp/Fnr family transcriptional regulator [Pedobacter sp. KBW06]RQO75229.1 Crp/Fnr family transcriptional regulator [Pedobacter sp. KBW06]
MGEEHAFTLSLINSLKTLGKKRICSRGELLLKEGEIEKNLYYIESGAVRVFLLSAQEEQTIRLGYQGSIINSLSSFLKDSPSAFYMEAIRKTSVKVISKAELFEIVNKDIESLNGYKCLLETVIAQQMEREIDLLTVSPTERLQRVLERSPDLFQHIPLKYIAAYLRMTPETLSRIRNS